MRDLTKDVVIVGAGIAGLVAAWSLRDRDAVLLEAEGRVGGRIRSEPRGAYWLNLGAHLFPPAESCLGRIVSELGLETIPVQAGLTGLASNGRVLSRGRVETYPFRLPMPMGARVSFLRAGLRIHAGVREYLAVARPMETESSGQMRARLLAYRDDQTFAEYLGPVHPEVSSILRAAVNRVSAEPEELAAGAGLALFQFAGIFSRGREASQHGNVSGGSSNVPDRLARTLGDRVVLGAEVTRVAQEDHLVRVEFNQGGSSQNVLARAVIVATPAPVAHRIVTGLPPGLADALAAITYGPYVVGAILTKEVGPMPWDRIYAMVAVGKSFNLLVNTASILRSGAAREPGGTLMVYGSADRGRVLLEKTDQEIRDCFLRDLQDVYPESRGIVDEVVIQRWALGVPYARPGRHRIQAVLEQPVGNILLAGDYTAPFAEMETAAESGADAAMKVELILGDQGRVGKRPSEGRSKK
ncbi:MAG TPA: NAD(P)/FAD-dependent oxidoreductase [Candidatus Dormibacteraeota bacterium]|nr:NAD(P)/FAD-dependent oxidoreductase [Candidatus Dormibacteraeota bacterium]